MRLRKYVVLVLAAVLVAALWSATSVLADVNYGGVARSIGMGGAGLAVVDNPLPTSLINPAAMALSHNKFSLHMPSIDLRGEGAGLGDIADSLDEVSDTDTEGALALAREFGSEDTRLGLNLTTGVSVMNTNIGLGGEAVASIIPNAVFKEWAATGILPPGAVPGDAQATVSADAIVYLPSIAMGWKTPISGPGSLSLGARAKFARSKHFSQTVSLDASGTDVIDVGAETNQDDSGLGLDFGAIYQAENSRKTTYGIAITNLLKPNLAGIEQDRMISVGISTCPAPKVLVAADVVNITGAYGDNMQLRFGGEVQVAKKLALRAGYSGEGLCFGVGLFGLDLAFSGDAPFSIGQTLRF